MMSMITSVQNQQVKDWKKLHKRKYREKEQKFLIEGHHLVEEAKKSQWKIETVIVRDGEVLPERCQSEEIELVDERVFKEIAQTKTPQGIAAVIQMKKQEESYLSHTLLLDAIQDPGNLGTIIRTADAAGFQTIVLGEGTVDVYNEKVIRASQGSIFHVHIIRNNLQAVINRLKKEGTTIYAAALQEAMMLNDVVPDEKIALMLGNEGAGIEEQLVALADVTVKIPIHGKAESLNVSVAAGILMYHMLK